MEFKKNMLNRLKNFVLLLDVIWYQNVIRRFPYFYHNLAGATGILLQTVDASAEELGVTTALAVTGVVCSESSV